MTYAVFHSDQRGKAMSNYERRIEDACGANDPLDAGEIIARTMQRFGVCMDERSLAEGVVFDLRAAGFVIVPREATEEMVDAWRWAPVEPYEWRKNGQEAWSAFLGAAPGVFPMQAPLEKETD